ncbi:4Fe-4S dicluster domain-containing protein [Lysobacter humi (ex Lee et al. 2017)]
MPLPRPPATDPRFALVNPCARCGMCLPACPTDRASRDELESPRGRIALARARSLGALPPTAVGDRHVPAGAVPAASRCARPASCSARTSAVARIPRGPRAFL